MSALERTAQQAARYGLVGLVSNSLLFLAYLGLTAAGFGHKLAMSLVYAAGVAGTFLANGRWSFGVQQLGADTLMRYVSTYAAGYALNLGLLWSLVDRVGWPHAPVQGGLILVVAAFLFMTQKFWVFRAYGTGR